MEVEEFVEYLRTVLRNLPVIGLQEVRGVVGVIQDVSELKRAERSLRESETKSQTLFDVIPDLIFHFKEAGDFLDYRGAAGEGLAVAPSNFIGRNIAEVMPEDFAGRVL